jgi:enterochelin esterase-like enzyme
MHRLSVLMVGALLMASALVAQPPQAGPGAPGAAGAAGRGAGRGGFPGFAPQPKSPEVASDGKVTFRLSAPDAAKVLVNGDWPQGRNLAMTKDEKGVWSLTVGPLTPEIWAYTFSVDGVRMLDPGTLNMHRDGTRTESTVVVPGELSAYYGFKDGPHGTVAAVWYESPSLKLTRRMFVYTPAGYETSTTRYPVFYLLHGVGGDEDAWNSMGRASVILENMIAAGKAKPMIMVITNGNATQKAGPDLFPATGNGMGGARGAAPGAAPGAGAARGAGAPAMTGDLTMAPFCNSLVTDVIPFVEKTYRVLADKNHRALAGLSMGGAQTMFTALNHPDTFAYAGSFSGAFVMLPDVRPSAPQGAAGAPAAGQPIDVTKLDKSFPALNASANSKFKLLYFSCGTDDSLIAAGRLFQQWLKESKGLSFVVKETPGYAHVWPYWRLSLVDFLPRLF